MPLVGDGPAQRGLKSANAQSGLHSRRPDESRLRPSTAQPMPESPQQRRVFILQVALITAIIFVIVALSRHGVTKRPMLANTLRNPAMFLPK